MSPNKRPNLSVIVPARDAERLLPRSLSALGRPGRRPFELIVVDDASTDRTADAAARFADRVIIRSARGGPAAARNSGAKAARGGILFFVDADVRADRRATALVLRAFRRQPGWDAVFGSYDDRPAETNFLSQFKNLFQHAVHQNADERASTFWAGCGAVRARAFREAGGFDESWRAPAVEDVELGIRLKARGKTIRLIKELQATHLKRWTFWSLVRSDVLGRAIPWTRLAWSSGLPRDLNFRTADRLSGVLVWCLACGLAAAGLHPAGAGLAAGSALLLLFLHRPLYRFFLTERGPAFAAAAAAWHWFYLGYSSAVFALWSPLAILHRLLGGRSRRRSRPEPDRSPPGRG